MVTPQEMQRGLSLRTGRSHPLRVVPHENFRRIHQLEQGAIAEGYSVGARISAFRKIFYPDGAPIRRVAGAIVGGGHWNILIPGASAVRLPVSWREGGRLFAARSDLRAAAEFPVNGAPLDIGHLFAGWDAGQHPTEVLLGGGLVRMRSNKEAATFVGDLGSVVTKYIAEHRDSQLARLVRGRPADLDEKYESFSKPADMNGNADSYACRAPTSATVANTLLAYYSSAVGGSRRRNTRFAAALGTTGAAHRMPRGTHRALQREVLSAALAFAAGNNRRLHVTWVLRRRSLGLGFGSADYHDLYWNISGWVLELFLAKLRSQIAGEH